MSTRLAALLGIIAAPIEQGSAVPTDDAPTFSATIDGGHIMKLHCYILYSELCPSDKDIQHIYHSKPLVQAFFRKRRHGA